MLIFHFFVLELALEGGSHLFTFLDLILMMEIIALMEFPSSIIVIVGVVECFPFLELVIVFILGISVVEVLEFNGGVVGLLKLGVGHGRVVVGMGLITSMIGLLGFVGLPVIVLVKLFLVFFLVEESD